MRKNHVFLLSLIPLALSACSSSANAELKSFGATLWAFDSSLGYSYGLKGKDADITEEIADYVARMNRLTDPYHAYPNLVNLYTLNQNHQEYVVSEDLYDILKAASYLREKSEGYYNPMMGRLTTLWKTTLFGGIEPQENYQPTAEAIESAKEEAATYVAQLATSSLSFDSEKRSVARLGEGLIDLGGLVKGYVSEYIERKIAALGTDVYLINAGSSSLSLGTNAKGQAYKVALEYMDASLPENPCRYEAKLVDCSTSAIYEQYREVDGKIYSHVVSPITGVPLNDLSMAFLMGDDGAFLDAFSTATMVAGVEKTKEWEAKYRFKAALFEDRFGTKEVTEDGESFEVSYHYATPIYQNEGLKHV